MKLTVFQSDKGDCLLVTSNGGDGGAEPFHMLVDGGMSASYTRHVAPALGKMRKQGQRLNLVYVSHIDQDHISGVLQLFDDMMRWRVWEFQTQEAGLSKPKPDVPRPPEVDAVWHNAFHEQLGENAGAIEDLLAASALVLSGADDARTLSVAAEHRDLATSKAEAVRLSRRLGAQQLNIPLNQEFGRLLMCIKDGMPNPIELGGLKLHVIGPFAEDLDKLRVEWNEWLKTSQKQLKNIQRKAREDEESLIGTEAARLRDLAQAQAVELRDLIAPPPAADLAAAPKKLGVRKNVTTPNLASLMVLVEEDGKTVLLTGDGHSTDILRGLEHHGLMSQHDGKNLHVNVLKVQHHGSEHNLDEEFCRRVTADHYLFCGNGEHENPDLDVVDAVLDSRLGKKDGPNPDAALSPNAEAHNKFTLWFNSSESETMQEEAKAHMRELRSRVEARREGHKSRFTAKFLEGKSSFQLRLD